MMVNENYFVLSLLFFLYYFYLSVLLGRMHQVVGMQVHPLQIHVEGQMLVPPLYTPQKPWNKEVDQLALGPGFAVGQAG